MPRVHRYQKMSRSLELELHLAVSNHVSARTQTQLLCKCMAQTYNLRPPARGCGIALHLRPHNRREAKGSAGWCQPLLPEFEHQEQGRRFPHMTSMCVVAHKDTHAQNVIRNVILNANIQLLPSIGQFSSSSLISQPLQNGSHLHIACSTCDIPGVLLLLFCVSPDPNPLYTSFS